jgi:hypothetical protein
LSKGSGVDGETLHDLQEKLDVARIQQKLLNEVSQITDRNVEEEKKELNSELLNVTDVSDTKSLYLITSDVQQICKEIPFVGFSIGYTALLWTQRPNAST